VDLGAVALIAVVAGLAGGAVGAALVGTVEGVLRQRQSHSDRGSKWVSNVVRMDPPQPSAAIERLDIDSRKVVTLAHQEAIQSGHSYIGSENLSMALRLYQTPTLDRVWSQLKIDSDVLRRRIEAAVPPTLGIVPTEGSWTQRVATIVRMAHAIAAERQREEVPPEHLLIALATEGGGAGAEVLASLGATPQRIREIVDGPTP
jgi:ABC-type taurine transport system substrate-binding protein